MNSGCQTWCQAYSPSNLKMSYFLNWDSKTRLFLLIKLCSLFTSVCTYSDHMNVFLQPPTAKMHAIIERTANFVCKQGAQFEIMLKAKQARNSQFDFLRFDHYLNPYYKFIQKAMKEGRYTVLAENKNEEKKSMWIYPGFSGLGGWSVQRFLFSEERDWNAGLNSQVPVNCW